MNKREFEVANSTANKILELSFDDDNVGYILVTVFNDHENKNAHIDVFGNMGKVRSKYLLQDLIARKVLDKKEGGEWESRELGASEEHAKASSKCDEEALTKALEGNNDGKKG